MFKVSMKIVVLCLTGVLLGSGVKPAFPDTVTTPAADPSTLRHTHSGDLEGYRGAGNTIAWSGIPYAKPPVGDLRWRAPQAPTPWSGTRLALTYGSACPQKDEESVVKLHGGALDATGYVKQVHYQGEEDCLYLNVRRPAVDRVDAASRSLPVMVYIHGGGNAGGTGRYFDSSALVSGQNVVLVTLNYRLGHLGFFTHPALRSEVGSDEDHSGNYGVLDQIQVLRWVRDNIAVFGGDPKNVTIFGISAGGMDSIMLLSSPLAAGLFERAIPMSGYTTTRTVEEASNYMDVPSIDAATSSGELLLQSLMEDGKAADRYAAEVYATHMSPEAVAAYLRSKSYEDLDRADASAWNRTHATWAGIPIRDGHVIPKEGIAASFARRDGHNRVPVMIGTTLDEDQVYVIPESRYVEELKGPQGVYFHFKDARGFLLVSEYMSLLWKALGADELATSLTVNQPGTIFGYRLDFNEYQSWLGSDNVPHGASHGTDLEPVFGLPPGTQNYGRWTAIPTAKGKAGYFQVSKAMMSYWGEFAYTGKPGKGRNGELPEWMPWNNTAHAPKFMVLNSEAGGGMHMSPDSITKPGVLAQLLKDDRFPSMKEKCQFLRQLVSYSNALGRIKKTDYDTFADGACAHQEIIR